MASRNPALGERTFRMVAVDDSMVEMAVDGYLGNDENIHTLLGHV